MIHHPVILVPKLIALGIVILALVILRGFLTPSQFRFAIAIAVAFFLVASVIIWIVAARLLANPNSRIGKAAILVHEAKAEDGFRASSDQFASLVGRRGVAISNLNPAGTVLVDERRISVMTDGEFVEANSAVEVVETKGSRIVVRGLKAETPS